MKLITLGQKVVTTIDYAIEEKEILWGFIIDANPNTGEGIVMHATEVDEDGKPMKIAVLLEDLIYIEPELK